MHKQSIVDSSPCHITTDLNFCSSPVAFSFPTFSTRAILCSIFQFCSIVPHFPFLHCPFPAFSASPKRTAGVKIAEKEMQEKKLWSVLKCIGDQSTPKVVYTLNIVIYSFIRPSWAWKPMLILLFHVGYKFRSTYVHCSMRIDVYCGDYRDKHIPVATVKHRPTCQLCSLQRHSMVHL